MFDKNLIFVAENYVCKNCGDVNNDVMLMPQFLEVVRQHVLGVVVILHDALLVISQAFHR